MRLASLTLALLSLTPLAASAQDAPDKRPTWFIFLEKGGKTSDDKDLVEKMQRGHIANFQRLFGEKKLFAAGPMSDPSGKKRGIVVVRAETRAELLGYFEPDDYVREGYMTINAERAAAHRALHTEGIDPNGIEEERIVQISRPAKPLSKREDQEHDAFLKTLLDKGTVGAWYTLEAGPIAEVLFCRTTDTKALEEAFAALPVVKESKATVQIWPQYLSKGVVR